MLHRLGDDPFDEQMQLSQLRYLVSSEAAARSLAENYVGLPIDHSNPRAAAAPARDAVR